MDKNNCTTHSWRDKRYLRSYEIVDSIGDELQVARPEKGGKAVKRKSRGARFESLKYSVEKIIRDCAAVFFKESKYKQHPLQNLTPNTLPTEMTKDFHIKANFEQAEA